MARDPVCQMEVEPPEAAAQSKYKGQTYYFCAVGCKEAFDRDRSERVADGVDNS